MEKIKKGTDVIITTIYGDFEGKIMYADQHEIVLRDCEGWDIKIGSNAIIRIGWIAEMENKSESCRLNINDDIAKFCYNVSLETKWHKKFKIKTEIRYSCNNSTSKCEGVIVTISNAEKNKQWSKLYGQKEIELINRIMAHKYLYIDIIQDDNEEDILK